MPDTTESRPLIVDPALVAARVSGGAQFVEGAQFRGHEELLTRVAHAHKDFVESGAYTVADAGDATGHDDIVMFTIQLVSTRDGRVAWAARVFLLLDQDCRVRADYQLTVQPLAT